MDKCPRRVGERRIYQLSLGQGGTARYVVQISRQAGSSRDDISKCKVGCQMVQDTPSVILHLYIDYDFQARMGCQIQTLEK
jgi:hypothetical protein